MTRDEVRVKCIEAMAKAHVIAERAFVGEPGTWEDEPPDYQRYVIDIQTAAFNALNGIAFVLPLEATEEMLDAATDHLADNAVWRVMAAAGDLTNPPEKKL